MKISAAIPLLDIAPPPAAAPSDAGSAGKGFETAVRAVAEKAGDRSGAPAPEKERVAEGRKDSAPSAHASKPKDEHEPKDDDAPADASATAGPTTPAAELLGRLLAASGLAQGGATGGEGTTTSEPAAGLSALSDADAATLAAAALAVDEAGSTFDGALKERLVITPLGAGAAEAQASGAAKGRGGVGLEVLHMETHFEPRANDVVLVEGAADAAAKSGAASDALDGVLSTIRIAGAGKGAPSLDRARTGEPGGATMRFDEALARLSAGEAAAEAGADADASDGRGAKGGRRAEGKASDETRLASGRAARSETVVEVKSAVDASASAASSMTNQIADRIIDAFRPSSGQERLADAAPGTTHLRMTAGGAALKTLTIQLQPENLGKLEVSMRLVDGRLTLELAASSAETAAALAHDRAGLKKLLEHAGFSMDEASITIVSRDTTLTAARSADAQDAGAQGQQTASGGRGGSDTSSGERGPSRDTGSDQREPSQGGRNRNAAEAEAPARRRSSVFL